MAADYVKKRREKTAKGVRISAREGAWENVTWLKIALSQHPTVCTLPHS